jgi:pimeloyl-ACP methyl ester carboxylesterase
MKNKILKGLLFLILLHLFIPQLRAQQEEGDIVENIAQIGDQHIHYLKMGSGSKTIVLLHGWPESSYMWKKMMPKLKNGNEFTIIAPDLSGVNGSSAPHGKFDKATLAHDIHKLIKHLELQNIMLIGHDIGGMVAYAYTRLYPTEILGTAILDVPLPGLGTWDNLMTTEHVWHFRFHDQKPLAENLIMGKQEQYFRYFIDGHSANRAAIDHDAIKAYSKAYSTHSSLNAGFEWYRTFPQDVLFNISHKEKIKTPILLVGAEYSMKDSLEDLKNSLSNLGINSIKTAVVMGSGHYLVEEELEETSKILLMFITDVYN